MKNEHLKKDSKFALIYEKDKKNRQEVARLLESAVSALADPQAQKTEIPVPTFPQMVNNYRENLCTNSINRRTKPNCFIFIQNRPKIQVEKAILKQLEKQKKYLLQQVFV